MYQLTTDPDAVLRLADGACIPRGHRFWGEYESWVSAGGVLADAPDTRAIEARAKRSGLLRASDWTQLADCPLSPQDRLAWAGYRAKLRDLPALPGFPEVEWPRAPVLTDGTADQGATRG